METKERLHIYFNCFLGVHSFPKAISGKNLPNSRKISTTIYKQGMTETISKISLSTMQYGQIVTHDMSFTYLRKYAFLFFYLFYLTLAYL